MQTLTYGLQRPETGDKGSVFFTALEDNITQLDGHKHDGNDSCLIPSNSLNLTYQILSAASWVSLGSGNYRQLVTMPSGFLFDSRVAFFRNNSDSTPLSLSVEKVSSNTFYVYINDNSFDVRVIYI